MKESGLSPRVVMVEKGGGEEKKGEAGLDIWDMRDKRG